MSGAIVGLDPSMGAAGIAILKNPRLVEGRNRPELKTIGSENTGGTIGQRALRIGAQGDAIISALPERIRLVLVEGMPFRQPKFSGLYQERCALLYDVTRFLVRRGIPVIEVSVTTIKYFATGDGQAEKDAVMKAMATMWPGAAITDDNRSDALAIATIGAMHLGWYEPELPCHFSPKIDWTGVNG